MGWPKSTGLLVIERQGYYRPVKCGLRNLQAQDLKWFSNYFSATQSNPVPVALEERSQQKLTGMSCLLALHIPHKETIQYLPWSSLLSCQWLFFLLWPYTMKQHSSLVTPMFLRVYRSKYSYIDSHKYKHKILHMMQKMCWKNWAK